jgi:hypothetical protein
MFLAAVYHNLDFSEALEKLGQVEKNKGEEQVCLCFMPNQDTAGVLRFVPCRCRFSLHVTSYGVLFVGRLCCGENATASRVADSTD